MKNYFPLLVCLALTLSIQSSFAQTPQWRYLGDTIVEQTWISGTLTYLQGDARYVAYQTFDNSNLTWNLKQYDGLDWVAVDTNGLGNENFRKLGVTANGVLQLAYFNSESNKFGVKRLINGVWQTISESPAIANAPYLASYTFDDETFWVAFPEEGLGNKITVWKFANGAWSTVGQPGFSLGSVHSIVLQISNGIPWVAYEDWSLGSAGIVQKFDGNTWQNVGNQVFNGDPHDQMDFVVSNGIPYLVHADSSTQSRANVVKFDGTNWLPIGSFANMQPTTFLKLAIDADDQEPYLLLDDAGPNFWGLSAMRFNGTSWDFVGARAFISNYWNLEFVINDGIPYVGYEFSPFGGGVSVQFFSPSSSTTAPQSEALSFEIQPNPIADGVLQIQINPAANTEAFGQIFDQNGRIVLQKALQLASGEATYHFQVGNLPPGVYALRLQSKHRMEAYTQRFVVAQ